jgi:hypothetical protein
LSDAALSVCDQVVNALDSGLEGTAMIESSYGAGGNGAAEDSNDSISKKREWTGGSPHRCRKSTRNENEAKSLRETVSVTMHEDKTGEVIDCIAAAMVELYLEKKRRKTSARFDPSTIVREQAA